jgi:hypothetical protein
MIEYQINPQTRYLNSSFQFPEKNRFSLLGLYRPYSLPRVFWKPGKLQRYKIEEQAFVVGMQLYLKNIRRISTFRAKALPVTPDGGPSLETSKVSLYF